MNTTAVIVTYADRSSYVRQVVDRLLLFNIYRIVIVNNNSAPDSAAALESLASFCPIIILINLDANTGSAFAFNRGIESVLADTDSEYLWLLDDDNLPDVDACTILQKNIKSALQYTSRDKIIISLIRDKRQNYIRSVQCSLPEIIIGRKNIFRSFHIASFFDRKTVPDKNIVRGDVSAVPYGGMFFHKEVVKRTGFPDENYYLYSDDFDFCCRHTALGGKIILSLESGISDVETSWNVRQRAIDYIAAGDGLSRIYYSVRNRVCLEKKYLVTCWPLYILNLSIYSLIVTLLALSRLKINNLLSYYTALYHGLIGRMGYNEKYRI